MFKSKYISTSIRIFGDGWKTFKRFKTYQQFVGWLKQFDYSLMSDTFCVSYMNFAKVYHHSIINGRSILYAGWSHHSSGGADWWPSNEAPETSRGLAWGVDDRRHPRTIQVGHIKIWLGQGKPSETIANRPYQPNECGWSLGWSQKSPISF